MADWHKCRFSRKLIIRIQPPITRIQLAVDSTTLSVSTAMLFKLQVCPKWEMCREDLGRFENIPQVECFKDIQVIFNPTIISKAEIKLREEISQAICRVEWSIIDVYQSRPQMEINRHINLLAKWLRLLKVMCRSKSMPWIPLFWVLLMLVVQSSCFPICIPSPHFPLKLSPNGPLSGLDQG